MCAFHLQGTSLFDYTLRNHPLKIACIIDHDVRDHEKEFNFRAGGIQIAVVDGNLDLFVLLGNANNIGHPIRVLLSFLTSDLIASMILEMKLSLQLFN